MRQSAGLPRAAASVAVAIAISSALGYALLLAVGRSMSPAEFGTFIAFWGAFFGLASSLANVEQETSRKAAEGELDRRPTAGVVMACAAAITTAVAGLVLVPPVGHRIFGAAVPALSLVMVVAGPAFAVQFATRGLLIGSGRTRRYGVIIVVEAAVRLVALVAVVLVTGSLTASSAALCVGLGSFAWLCAPSAVRSLAKVYGGWRDGMRQAGALMFAAGLNAVLITGFPTLVTGVTGQTPGSAGGATFAALTVSRVPLLLVSPLQALTVPAVVAWRSESVRGSERLRAVLVRAGAVVAVLTVLGALAGWVVGPWTVRLLYGDDYTVEPFVVALLVASSVLLAGALLVSAALIALEQRGRVMAMWLTALVVTVAWLLLAPTDLHHTTAWAALAGPVLALLAGVPALWRRAAAAPAET